MTLRDSATSGVSKKSRPKEPERNLKLTIEYDGTRYCGWQTQKKHSLAAIQETIEKALQTILRERVNLIASGRTDAGVHAIAQVANFKSKTKLDITKLAHSLNCVLPEDICVNRIEDVSPDFHSRIHARAKTYRYVILNRKNPSALLRGKVYFCHYPLNFALMRKEACILLGRHDFRAFRSSDSAVKDNVRTIYRLDIKRARDLIYIDIEANGFMYNMVRNIVGTLIDIGRGKIVPGQMKKILLSRNRSRAGATAAACGLYLLAVKY